jgi:transitional endoplasmic reticulum ATPase
MAPETKAPSQYEQSMAKAYKTLTELGGQLVQEEDITRGDKFVIPHSMTLGQAQKFLQLKEAEAAEVVTLDRTFEYRFKDGAVALTRALHKFFGTFSHKGTMGFWGPNPPAFEEVAIGYGEKIQIPVGAVACPAIPDTVLHLTEARHPELGTVFRIVAETRRRHRPAVEALLGMIEQHLREESIYKGKAIDAEFNFLDLSKVDKNKVVYAADTYAQVEASIFSAIRFPAALRKAGVSLKSAVLLSGTFGVGKTLLAYLTGQECEAHGVTFIQVRPNRDSIEEAIQTAAMYSPSVVFFEDLDTISNAATAETDHISGLLEMFDGVRAKGREVMAILTTNHPELIHKGMLRPGRLDAVIEVGAPDKQGIIRLCKTLIPAELLAPGITEAEWDAAGEAMDGYLPAFVHEACKRAIKYSLVRAAKNLGESEAAVGGELDGLVLGDKETPEVTSALLKAVRITGEDVRLAGVGLRAQFDQMLGAKTQPERDTLSEAFRAALRPDTEDAARQQVLAVVHPRAIHPENVDEAQAAHEAEQKARR